MFGQSPALKGIPNPLVFSQNVHTDPGGDDPIKELFHPVWKRLWHPLPLLLHPPIFVHIQLDDYKAKITALQDDREDEEEIEHELLKQKDLEIQLMKEEKEMMQTQMEMMQRELQEMKVRMSTFSQSGYSTPSGPYSMSGSSGSIQFIRPTSSRSRQDSVESAVSLLSAGPSPNMLTRTTAPFLGDDEDDEGGTSESGSSDSEECDQDMDSEDDYHHPKRGKEMKVKPPKGMWHCVSGIFGWGGGK